MPLSDSIHLHPATPTQSFNANSISNTSTGSTSLAQVYVDVHILVFQTMLGEKVPHQHIAIHTGHTEFLFVVLCPREMCFGKIRPKIVWENPVGSNSLPNKNKTTCYFWLETEPPCEPINKYTISFKFHFLKLEGQVRIFVRKIIVVHVIVFARGQIPLSQKRTI